ncbi:MAG TPA: hypothetical protein VMT68_16865 [Caulobacteraceae bacterium]|nr:hypothetical protein [Caulobacteraceae bacterium]
MRVFGPVLGRDPARLATALILSVGAGGALALNLPGHLSYDSVVQLAEGRAGVYSGVHPPVMSWLLGVADGVWPGTALFVTLDVALIFGALIALARLGPRTSWRAAPVAVVAIALPQMLVYPGIVWKDVLFAGAMVAGFAALAAAARVWDSRRWRNAWLAAALGLLTLAALARQNGGLVLPIAGVAVAAIAARAGSRRRLAWGAGFLAAGAALTLAASAALATRLDGTPAMTQAWENLELGDLVAAVARQPRLQLKALHAQAPEIEARLRTQGVAAMRPDRLDTLDPLQRWVEARDGSAALVFDQWRALILGHPWLYLRVRAEAFRWVFATPDPARCVMVETGIDGPADGLVASHLSPRKDARDGALEAYALTFQNTPVSRHVTYAAVAIVLLAWLLRRRAPADLAVAAMLATALAFAASFFVISIACDYRYLYALDVSTIAAALYAAASAERSP